jgi:hypothetical protein
VPTRRAPCHCACAVPLLDGGPGVHRLPAGAGAQSTACRRGFACKREGSLKLSPQQQLHDIVRTESDADLMPGYTMAKQVASHVIAAIAEAVEQARRAAAKPFQPTADMRGPALLNKAAYPVAAEGIGKILAAVNTATSIIRVWILSSLLLWTHQVMLLRGSCAACCQCAVPQHLAG